MNRRRILVLGNGLAMVALVVGLLAWPVISAVGVFTSGDLARGDIPAFTERWHRSLSADLAPWARERVASGRAETLAISDIAGTEWPMFSSVFYLWATEALEDDAIAKNAPTADRPSHYARDAIRAAVTLIADPGHAAWVRQHWGSDYLDRENLFYRMLLISGLTSYQKLTGDPEHEPLLRRQVTSLAAELDASPHGLLDDYPGQCYPIDILPAIAAIRRADRVLGTDHSAIVARAIRGFEGERLDAATGLPAYVANSRTGKGQGHARGVGGAFMTLWAAEVWPDRAREWYPKFERHFWQAGNWVAGFREYPASVRHDDLLFDVDAGPVVLGLGTTASAFAIGTARTLGRFDHAWTLSAQAVALMWPLPDGTRLAARLLSSITDAPFTGEAIMLFNFTRTPMVNVQPEHERGATPWLVHIVLGTLTLVSAGLIALVVRLTRRRLTADATRARPVSVLQTGLWLVLVVGGLVLACTVHGGAGLAMLLVAQFLPFDRMARS